MLDLHTLPNAVVTHFVPLIQLVVLFLQERRDDKEMTLDEFSDWLAEHHFSELKLKLDSSQQMQAAIANLLKQNHTETLSKFAFIEEQLAKISSQLEGFSDIAQLAKPDAVLSDQAMGFLTSLADPDVTDLFASTRHGIITQVVLHRASRKTGYSNDTSHILEITGPRFATQDLEELEFLGLTKCDNPYSEGGLTYRLTRHGENFIQTLHRSK
jgi:hypothetical protein